MVLKKIAATAAFLAGLLMPGKAEADNPRIAPERNDARITLQYDYFSRGNSPDIEYWVPIEERASWQHAVRGSEDYYHFVENANQHNLTTQEKIRLLSVLGYVADDNYDFSMPRRNVSAPQIFLTIQENIQTGYNAPAGVICGGIHNFLMNTAQNFGMQAVTFDGRTEGRDAHIFAGILGDNGFVNLNYFIINNTRTFNFYRALELNQKAQGNITFDQNVYDGRFLFRHITRDGRNFYRFVGFNPDLDEIIHAISDGTLPFDEGCHIVLGNTELSAALDTRALGIFELTAKAGRIYGSDISPLTTADFVEGVFRTRFSAEDMHANFRAGVVYGVLDESDRDENGVENKLIMLLEGSAGDKQRIGDFVCGVDLRVFCAFDISKEFGLSLAGDVVYVMDAHGALSVGYGPVSAYAAGQAMHGYNNVSEQDDTIHLGDVELGTLITTPFGTARFAGRMQPESYAGRVGFENRNLSVDARYGVGRHGVFTPDFAEASVQGVLPLTESLSLEASLSGRYEWWSHGERSIDGTASAQLGLKF